VNKIRRQKINELTAYSMTDNVLELVLASLYTRKFCGFYYFLMVILHL